MKKFALNTTNLRTLGQNVSAGPGSNVTNDDTSLVWTVTLPCSKLR